MSAVILARMLRQLVGNYIKTLRNKIYDRCNKGKHVDIAALVSHDDTLTRDVAKAFSDGEVTVQKDASNAGLGVILMVQQGNKLATETDIERVSTALPRDGKYVMGRSLDCSSKELYGPAQTPEGAAVGLLQNPAACARVRLSTAVGPVLSQLLALGNFAARVLALEVAQPSANRSETKQEIAEAKEAAKEAAELAAWCRSPAFIRPLECVNDLQSQTAPPATAFIVSLNGEPVGVTDNEELFARVARAAKREGVLPRDASIVRDTAWRGVTVFVDAGVMVRATLHLPSIHRFSEAAAAAKRNSTLLWHEMERAGMVEWIDAWEGVEYRIADLPDEVSAYLARADPFERPYSHIAPHPQAFFSTGESTIPFANHNQGPRVVYQSAMACQTGSILSENMWARMDFLSANAIWYPQRPLASTDLARAKGLDDCPMGQNLMIAFAISGGNSQEDALIVNKDSQQRGLMRMTVLKIERDVAKARGSADIESFERPGPHVQGLRAGVNYDTIGPDGMPCVGAPLRNGDAIIGKTMTSTTELDASGRLKTVVRDRTRVLECDPSETYYVDKVAVMPKDGRRMVRVRLRTTRFMEEGDKACLTPDHDVLVWGKGWTPIDAITEDDAIATLDSTTNTLVYARPTAVWAYQHFGDMYEWESEHASMCVTPEHRMWLRPLTHQSSFMEQNTRGFVLEPALVAQFAQHCDWHHAAPLQSPVLETAPDSASHFASKLNDQQWQAFLDLFGAWIVFGSVTPCRGPDIVWDVHFHVGCARSSRSDEWTRAARALGWTSFVDSEGELHLSGLCESAQALFVTVQSDEARRLPSWMLKLTLARARCLIEAALDASSRDDELVVHSKDLADDLQVVCAHAGVVGTVQPNQSQTQWSVRVLRECGIVAESRTMRRLQHFAGSVHCVTVPSGIFLVRRNGRVAFTGNSARHGQKGTVGEHRRQWDMPYVADGPNAGMTPDAIINVASMNGRMTLGMLLEMLFGALGLAKGEFVDATPFRNVPARWALAELCKARRRENGKVEPAYGVNVNMIDGQSGQLMEGTWFLAPCFYQRLKHMVLDKIAKRQRGLRAALTHQPMGGRSSGEAQRFGPMEALTLLAHGGAFTADDAMRVRSDAHSVPVCLSCGTIVDDHAESLAALVEASGSGGFCRLCRAYTPQVVLDTTYCNNLWQREVAGLGVKVTHDMGTGAARCANRTQDDEDDDDEVLLQRELEGLDDGLGGLGGLISDKSDGQYGSKRNAVQTAEHNAEHNEDGDSADEGAEGAEDATEDKQNREDRDEEAVLLKRMASMASRVKNQKLLLDKQIQQPQQDEKKTNGTGTGTGTGTETGTRKRRRKCVQFAASPSSSASHAVDVSVDFGTGIEDAGDLGDTRRSQQVSADTLRRLWSSNPSEIEEAHEAHQNAQEQEKEKEKETEHAQEMLSNLADIFFGPAYTFGD